MRRPPIAPCILLLSAALAATLSPASAAPGDVSDNQRSVCLVDVPTPLGHQEYQCTRGTITVSILGCETASGKWGCRIRGTASGSQDPGTCGYTTVGWTGARAISEGCGAPNPGVEVLGMPFLAPPVPASVDLPWTEAFPDASGIWVIQLPAAVEVHAHGSPGETRRTLPWEVQVEVPPPPPPSDGCAANGAGASASAGLSSVRVRVAVPEQGLVVEQGVSPLQMTPSAPRAGGGADAKFYADTGDVNC